MRKSLLLALLVLAGYVSWGQNLITEGFEGSTFPPSGWIKTTTAGGLTWAQMGVGTFPAAVPHGGSKQANFNSWYVASGSAELVSLSVNLSFATGSNVLTFWMYRDNGYATSTDLVNVYVNTAATVGGALLGTINRSRSLTPTVSADGWYQYSFTLPASYNGTTNYIIFSGTSNYGNDIFIDDVSLDHIVPCTSPVTAGTASATPTAVCANVPFTLSSVGYTVGSGMVYSWQSSPAGAGTWTNIAGATAPVYTVAAGITTATDYRFVDTCTLVANTRAISNTVSVTLSPPATCYCAQAATSNVDDDIGQVIVGAFANPTTTPSPLTSNTSSVNTYTNFTALGPIKMIAGLPTAFQVTQINSTTGYYICWLKAYIDVNQNGSWLDPGEQVFTGGGPGTPTSPSFTGTISVPATSTGYTTRMRLTLQESGTNASTTPCNSYTWGETEDYTVQVLSSTPPPPRVTNNSPVCPTPGSSFTVTVTDTSNGGLGFLAGTGAGTGASMTYTLTGPGGTYGPQASGVFVFNNPTAALAGNYTAVLTLNVTSPTATYPSASSYPSTVTLYSVANLTAINIVPTSTCTGSDGAFTLTGMQPNGQYTLRYKYNGVTVVASPNPITASATGTYTVSGLLAGAYDSVRVTNSGAANGGCISNFLQVVVPAPNPPATPIVIYQQPLCPGGTLQLSITNPVPGASHLWSSTPTGFNPTPNPSTAATATRANMTSAQNGSYCVTANLNGCVSSPGCVNVVVNAKDPKPIVVSPISYCQFEQALPLTAIGTNLNFTGPSQICFPLSTYPDSSKISRNPIIPRTDLVCNWVYYVTQNGTCLSDTAAIIVIIKPKPPMPTVGSPTVELCQFSNAGVLTASGANIRWFSTPTGGVGSATPPVPNTMVSGTFFYYVSQTISGCESDRRAIIVNVKPKPAPPQVSSPLNLCQYDPIGPVTAIGQNLRWYSNPIGGVGVPVAPLPNTGYEDSFKYWVTQTVNGCESDRALLAVYVNYKPNGVIVGTNQTVCQDENDTFYYYGNARPDAQYNWFAPFPQSYTIAGGKTQGPFIVHFDSAGTQVIRLQINNKGCISTLVAAPITVKPLPKIDYSLKRDVCQDELVHIALTKTEQDVKNYHFDFGSNDTTMQYSAIPGGPFGIRYHSVGEYTVGATATLNGCTSKPLLKKVSVHEIPNAKINYELKDQQDWSKLCSSDTINLIVALPRDGATYVWTPAAFFQSKEDSLNYRVRAVVSQSAYVKVAITTAYGCVGTDSIAVAVKPCCGIFFPNAFAPEGNVDKNKTFKPITIGFNKVNTFKVFNRWGQVVYETKSLPHTNTAGWDGTYNGVKQDMGVYHYYINYKCEGKNVEERGEVTLMR